MSMLARGFVVLATAISISVALADDADRDVAAEVLELFRPVFVYEQDIERNIRALRGEFPESPPEFWASEKVKAIIQSYRHNYQHAVFTFFAYIRGRHEEYNLLFEPYEPANDSALNEQLSALSRHLEFELSLPYETLQEEITDAYAEYAH